MAQKVSWGSITSPKESIEATAKIRQQHKPAKALIVPQKSASVTVEFEEPQMSVTAGQSIVFYKDDVVLGGGIIVKSL